jgi:hypothetical protein
MAVGHVNMLVTLKSISGTEQSTTETNIIIIIIIIIALQLFVGPWLLFQVFDPIHSREDPLDGDEPVASPLPTRITTQTQNKRAHRHSYLNWDSNSRPRLSSERRPFMP